MFKHVFTQERYVLSKWMLLTEQCAHTVSLTSECFVPLATLGTIVNVFALDLAGLVLKTRPQIWQLVAILTCLSSELTLGLSSCVAAIHITSSMPAVALLIFAVALLIFAVALLIFAVAILVLIFVILGGHNHATEAKPAGDVLADDASRLNETKAPEQLFQEVPRTVTEEVRSEFVCSKEKPLDGIIAHLTRECGGNVHEKGAIEVIASSVHNSYKAKSVVDLGSRSCFISNDEPDQWIGFDFNEQRVTPKRYSMRTGLYSHPRCWDLEVSNDGSEWEVVDRRELKEYLKGEYVTHNFTISAPPLGNFRFVRLRQTGENFGGQNCLDISSLEIFGTLSSVKLAQPEASEFRKKAPANGMAGSLTAALETGKVVM